MDSLIPPNAKHSGWTGITVRAFRPHQKSGYIPDAGLAVDRAGTFYGTTTLGGVGGGGTVFQLMP